VITAMVDMVDCEWRAVMRWRIFCKRRIGRGKKTVGEMYYKEVAYLFEPGRLVAVKSRMIS